VLQILDMFRHDRGNYQDNEFTPSGLLRETSGNFVEGAGIFDNNSLAIAVATYNVRQVSYYTYKFHIIRV
jgi:chromosome condensin MukBEF complex kleisin-like MukF subunit